MRLIDIIVEITGNISRLQKENGSFMAGHNGPYFDNETPVRSTSHFLILMSGCQNLTNNKKYKDKIYKSAEYLCSKDARPYGYTFYHRDKENKDKCNGLIGQAWTIEALVEATKTLEDAKYHKVGEELFLQHPFNYESGLWNRLEINGDIISVDKTFNHQLWFAACSSMLFKNNDLENRIRTFMGFLAENMDTDGNGLILHSLKNKNKTENIQKASLKKNKGKSISSFLNNTYKTIFDKKIKNDYEKIKYKSIGYHSFNMYAFALLKEQVPVHEFWNSLLFIKTLDYMLSSGYRASLNKNIYGYPYNPPGFEIPYALNIFSDLIKGKSGKNIDHWINEQIIRCYNKNTGMLDRNTTDPIIQSARMYELIRVPAEILGRIEIESRI